MIVVLSGNINDDIVEIVFFGKILRNGKDDRVELNLTPMVDVVLLLLCFFVLSSDFMQKRLVVHHQESQYGQNLEHKQRTQESAVAMVTSDLDENANIIDLLEDGRVHIDNQWQTLQNEQQIGSVLSRLAAQEHELIINAAAQTPHVFVVELMEICVALGYTKLRVAVSDNDMSP